MDKKIIEKTKLTITNSWYVISNIILRVRHPEVKPKDPGIDSFRIDSSVVTLPLNDEKSIRHPEWTRRIQEWMFRFTQHDNGLLIRHNLKFYVFGGITVIALFLIINPKTEAAWWNQLWLYRKPLTINYTGTTTLTNYQVKVTGAVLAETTLYTAGKIQKDCSDLRFTDSSGQQLYYWIEDTVDASDLLDCSATNYDVWVKVSTLNTGNNTIYFYYGNPQAQSESNGNNTFEFFDDFNASSLDTTKWNTTGTSVNGSVTIVSGSVSLNNTANENTVITSKNQYNQDDYVIHSRIRMASSTTDHDMQAGWSGEARAGLGPDDNDYEDPHKIIAPVTVLGTELVTTVGKYFAFQAKSGDVKSTFNTEVLTSSATHAYGTGNIQFLVNATVSTLLDYAALSKYAATAPGSPTIGSETGQSGAPVAFWPLTKSTFDSKTASLGDVINSADTGLPPVVWLTMDDNDIDSHSCPGGGLVAGVCDVSGNGNHGTANGSMTDSDYVTGKIGPKALDFDGSNDYLTEGKSVAGGWSQLSYGAWIKTGAATYQAIVNEWSGSANFAMQMNNGQINLHIRGSWDNGVLPYTINDNTWHHLFVTYDGTKEQLFLDGRLVFSKAYTGSIINSQSCYLKVGAYADASQVPGGLFTGQIDEVKVFNYARTADQVKADYYNTRAYFGAGNSAPTWSQNGVIQGDLQGLPLMDFDGVDDYLTVADTNQLDVADVFSISTWIKRGDISRAQNILQKHTGAPALVIYSDNFVALDKPGTGTLVKSTTSITDIGNWHHILVTKNGATVKIFIDGQDKTGTVSNQTFVNNTEALAIGSNSGGTAAFYKGSIAGVKIFNYALSASQVKTQYSVGLDGQGAGVAVSMGGPSAGSGRLADGLVGYWKLDGDANDSSGNNNNGTLVNGSTYTSGKNSQALSVDGTDDYVTVPHNSAYNVTDFTVSLWTYYNGAGTGGKQYWTLLNKEATGNGSYDPFHMLVYTANYAPGIRVGNGSTAVNLSSASTPINDSKWHLLTASRQGSTIKLFVDGVQKDTQQLTGSTTNSAVMTLGVWPQYLSYYNGLLDEVRIYNRALSDDEISQLYQSGTGPIASYQIDENAGTIAKDSIANNHLNISQLILTSTKPTWQPGVNGSAISLNGVDNAFQTSENTGGLVGWWKMDESANDTCSGGQDACNSAGSSYHGTATGTTIVSGKFGKARSFNGSSEYVGIPTRSTFSSTTVSVWFKKGAVDTNGVIMSSLYWHGSGHTGYSIRLSGNKIRSHLYFEPTGQINDIYSPEITNTDWHHVALVFDANGMSEYLDGIKFASVSRSIIFVTPENIPDTDIGRYNFQDNDYFSGSIDDAQVFNRVLSESEVKDLYNNSKLSVTGSVSLFASVKPKTIDSGSASGMTVGGTVVSKGENYQLSTISHPELVSGSNVSRSSFTTNAITTQLSGTNINDVYFYDTTKDSVDSSWRFDSTKSWYTETIDATFRNCDPATHDRCGSKEFPEKAYIIATNNNVYIFDAAENAMWMRFDEYGAPPALANAYILGSTTSNTSSVYMMNGLLYIGKTSSDNAWNLLYETKFISDSALYYHVTAGNSGNYNSTIVNRNAGSGFTVSGSIPVIVARNVNDVHAAVISGKTYVAVATDGGISLINETDGTVANMAITVHVTVVEKHVYLTTNNVLYFSTKQNNSSFLRVKYNASALTSSSSDWGQFDKTYAADQGAGNPTTPAPAFGWSSSNQNQYSQGSLNGLYVTEGTSTIDGTSNTIYAPSNNGVTIIQEKQGDESNGSVKYITKDYITEEMIGDIRGMWPFNGTGSIANATDISSVSVNATTMTSSNANGTGMTYATGVRGTGITFDGTDDYLKQKVYYDQTGATFGPTVHGLNLSTTAAFYRVQGRDLSTYHGTDGSTTPYMLVLKDSALKTAWGYIGSTDAAEALGGELVTNGSFTTDTSNWIAQQSTLSSVAGGQSGNAMQVQNTTTNYGYGYQAITTVVGKLYKVSFYHKNGTGGGNFWMGTSAGGGQLISNMSFTDANWALKTYYFTATTTTSYIRLGLGTNVDGATTLFDEVAIKEVTDVGVDGVHIVSAKNGGTRNWAGIESGFNYNDTAYTFEVRKTDFQLTTGFSVGLWVKPNTTPQYIGLMSKGRITGDTNGWSLEYNASNKIVIVGNGGCTTSGSITTSASTWTHIVAVANSSTNVSLYANGVLQDTSNFACGSGIIDTFSPQVIGKTNASPLTGTIDEAFVTAEALTADQIKRMYEVGRKSLQNAGTSALNGSSNQVNAVAVSGLSTRLDSSLALRMTRGILYAGTEGGGVSVIDLTSDTLMRAYTTTTNPAINHANVNALTVTTDGNFIAALDSGLSRVNGVSGNANLSTTKYTDVVGVFDKVDGYYKLYENNSLVGKTYVGTSHSPVTNTSKLALGGILPAAWTIDADNPLPTTNFYGAIDNVNIYDYAVSPRELNITSGNGASDPVLYLPFEEGEGIITSNRNWQKSGTTTNIVTNPSTETNLTGYSNNNSGTTRTLDATERLFGNYSQKVITSGSVGSQGWFTDFWVSLPGVTYTASVYLKGSGTVSVMLYSNPTSLITSKLTTLTTEWQRVNLTGVTPSNSTNIYIIVATNPTQATTFWTDGVQLEQAFLVTPYCDGSLKGNGTHTWSGTAHASTSTCEYGSDGELMNGVTWQNDGVKGKSLRFDGVDDYVKTPSDILKTPAAVSVSGWFRTGTTALGDLIFSIEGYYAMYHDNGQLKPFFDGSSGGNLDYGSGLNNNQWHHFVAMNNGTTTMLYVDGKSIASFAETLGNIDTLKNGVGIGSQYDGTLSQCFNGDIDEIKIFPYELTPSEIKVEYNLGAALKLGGTEIGHAELVSASNSNGLVGYWKMDEASWNGTAGEVIDSSGAGNNGVRSGDATTTSTAKYNRAGTFDGTGDRVDITDNIILKPATQITVSGWIKTSSLATNQDVLNKGDGTNPGAGYRALLYTSGSMAFWVYDGSQTLALAQTGASTVSVDQWYQFTGTYDGKSVKIYLNGELKNTSNEISGFTQKAANLYIGGPTSFSGQIDDVKIYNRALSDTEIRNLYNLGTAPVAEWRLDENNGITAKDSSSSHPELVSGNNGVLTNGPIWVSGVKGSSLSFDGSDDYVMTADNVIFPQGNVDFAVTAWVNLSSKSAVRGIATKGNGSSGYGNYEWDLRYTTATDRFRFTVQNGSNQVQDVDANNLGSPSLSTWYYIHAWHNSINDTINIQVNGGAPDSAQYSFGGWDSTHSVMIGRSTGYFAGSIDNVRVFNYVLTPYQIAQEFNGGKPVAQWSFDEGSGQSVHNTGGINALGVNSHSTLVDGSLGGSLTDTNNDPDWVMDETSCKKGKCLDFEYDNSQYLQLADNVLTVGEDLPWSYSAWVNVEDFHSGSYPAFYGNELTTSKYQRLQFYQGTYIAIEDKNNSGTGLTYKWTHGMSTGQWNLVTVVCNGTDSNNVELYINGVSKGKITMATTEFEIRQIGARGTGTMGFDGKMDDIKVFNYALSVDDILREYNQGAAIRY